MVIKVFYSCSHWGRLIVNEKKEKYFICPNCENVLCKVDNLRDFNNNYCGNCGYKLASAKNEVLALVKKENMKIKNMVELKSQSTRKKIMRYKNGRPYFEER